MNAFRRFFVVVFCWAMLPGAANSQATPVFDAEVSLTIPLWADGNVSNLGETYENLGKNGSGNDFYILEFVPPGESFEDWSELYALSGERPLSGTPEGDAGGQIAVYQRVCEDLLAQMIHKSESRADFLVLCGNDSTRDGQGEFAVFRMEKIGETLIKIYHHKRGPSFDPEDQTSWFFTSADIVSRYEHFRDTVVRPRQ